MGNENNINQGAREMADLLKDGKVEQFVGRIGADQEAMSREDFSTMIKKIKEDNVNDVAAQRHVIPLTLVEGADGQPIGAQLKYSGWRVPSPSKIQAEKEQDLQIKPIEQL